MTPVSLFRKFVDASATAEIRDNQMAARLGCPVHNPHLIEAG